MTGPLGAFVVWRRLAYFGDTLAHAALLGVALGLFWEIQPQWAVIGSSAAVALLLVGLGRQKLVATDTLLGVLSHSALAAGLVSVSLLADSRVDLYALLFGDLLTANATDVVTIFVVAVLVIGCLLYFWRDLLSATLDEDLARVEGINCEQMRLLLMLLVAVVVAFAMKVVGVLLITALLLIPAAASRRLSKSPEAMAVGASAIGAVAVIAGLAASYWWDTPAGPSIVLAATCQFALSLLVRR